MSADAGKDCVVAFDLGTGGVKAAFFQPDGTCVAVHVETYNTHYPGPALHEQRPADWWATMCASTAQLLTKPGVDPERICAVSLSGHSLGCIPVGKDGELLQQQVPIWSDSRATAEAEAFFTRIAETEWYLRTGNGFPPPLYTVFKIMWLKARAPEIFEKTAMILGTKDYLNLHMTGRRVTDPSYASGSGVFDLVAGRYAKDLVDASGLSPDLFPPIVPSTEVIGTLLPGPAEALGLSENVKVLAGGVDNSLMALGGRTFREGDAYASMGSSSWITVASSKPLLDARVRPFVFAHAVPGMFVSATSIFSSGTSVGWVMDTLLTDLGGDSAYEALFALAGEAPAGANGLLFIPTLGGGTSFEGGPSVRGAYVGLDLHHTRADIARASLEGVALGLGAALDELRRMTDIGSEMIAVGGGAKSPFWLDIFANVFDCTVVKTSIDQQSAALGAAALAFVGLGIWPDFDPIRELHQPTGRHVPEPTAVARYRDSAGVYLRAAEGQSSLAPDLAALRSGAGR